MWIHSLNIESFAKRVLPLTWDIAICVQGTYDPDTPYWRKLGIYSYTAEFLPKFIKMPVSKLQKAEDLEQNKVTQVA